MRAFLINITQTLIEPNFKWLIIKGVSFSSTFTAEEYGPYGMDSRPIAGTRGIYLTTDQNGDEGIIGVLNKNRLAEIGENRNFATDSSGVFKFNCWMRADGTILIGDSETPTDFTNFAVMFNELKTEFNKLKADYNDLVTKVNANAVLLGSHTHPIPPLALLVPVTGPTVAGVTAPSGVPGQNGSLNNSNIDNAKNDKVKFN